jgi:hypothetical protein
MSRSRWTPFLFALVAGASAWLAWRFVPRDWLDRCCGSGARRPRADRPRAAPAGSVEARVVDPVDGDGDDESDDSAERGATQADDPARCAAVTQGGTRCSREVEPGSTHCWQHGG